MLKRVQHDRTKVSFRTCFGISIGNFEYMDTLDFRYVFSFPNGRKEVIDLCLDSKTLDLVVNISGELPEWTKLCFHRCPNCQLNSQAHEHCPVAANLMKLVPICKSLLSYDKIHVDVITPERVVSKDTDAQKGISSMMGFIMATSGCPHMSFFKPMARFHLPLANAEETIYRAASMYLLAQYFLRKEGREADLELEGLAKIYYQIRIINEAMARRLRDISDKDSALNALVILDIFATTLPYAIEKSLDEIRYLFKPCLY